MGLAARWVEKCSEEELEQAEKACIHYDRPIRIKELVRLIKEEKKEDGPMPNLAVDFC
jgi:dihydropyrimidine dehydrogenase (NAD+) subunit PreA